MNKKILIIINNLGIGGAERLVVSDINEMLRVEVDVTLITLRPEPKKSFASELTFRQDRFHCIPFTHSFSIFSWFKLICILRVSKPDLVITHLWFANTVGRIAAKIAGIKNVITFEQNVYDTVKTRKMFFIDWLLLPLSTKIIAVSEAVRRSLVRHHIHKSKIDVLHNSVDLEAFRTSSEKALIRREYGIPEHAFIFVFIGRLIYQKAVDVLIEAFKTLETDLYLLIVGQGKDRAALERKVKEGGLEKHIIFAGVRNDIPKVLLSSDCFILPSRYEGLPLVLTEALAAGLPIIVSDFEAAKEIITHEENGLVVPPEDARALAVAMLRVKNDDLLRSRIAGEAKKSAERLSIYNHVRALLRYVNIQNL